MKGKLFSHSRTCATILERDDLFPESVLKRAGFDPSTVATLELPMNGTSYSDVCQYTAHFGVDAFTPEDSSNVVRSTSSKDRDTQHVSSHQGNKQVPNPVTDERVPVEVRPLLEQGVDGALIPRRMGPGLLSTLAIPDESENESLHLGNSPENSDSDASNASLTDLGSDLDAWYDGTPSNKAEKKELSNDDRVKADETGKKPASTEAQNNEDDGKPSSSQADPNDADDEGEGSDNKDAGETDPKEKPSRGRVSTHGLRRRRQRNVPRLCLGAGYAKVRVVLRREGGAASLEAGDHDNKADDEPDDPELKKVTVLVRHMTFLEGIGIDRGSRPFRLLALASTEPRALAQLCATARAWREDRREKGETPRPGRFTLYRYKVGQMASSWENEGYKKSRPARSVILKDDMLEAIIQDLREFVAKDTKAWYESHGLPHRRSLLFHGPPGCGKTSTIKMLAGMFRLNACFLSFSAPNFSNSTLQDALADLPSRALLVLEDVDVLFNVDRKAETASSVTFSGLLNALDGLISVDGIVTIFTTNHLERLDPALIRAGRVDRRFEFVHPNAKHLAKLFQSFYPDASDSLAQKFATVVLDRPEEEARSIATLQQHFIFTRKVSAEESVKTIPKFFKEFYPKAVKERPILYM